MKLSIIVPVYNVEAFLPKCLDSLIFDKLEDYEIILVNDGSTDSSAAIMEEYSARHSGLIRTLTKENGGLGSARNAGISVANGEYLLFVDSDDWLSENAVPEILGTIQRGFDICLFDFSHVNMRGNIIERINGGSRDGPFSLAEYPELLLERHETWNKIYKKSLFTDGDISFPDRAWFEDLSTIPKLYLSAGNVIYVRQSWYNYLRRPGSIMNSKNLQRNLEIISAVDETVNYYKQNGVYAKYREQLEYLAFYNQFLTASVRVNLSDPKSPLLDTLRNDFLSKYPDYRQNPYVKNLPGKHKIITRLLERNLRLPLNLLLKLNEAVKRKDA